jgi:hypothetical protein
MKRFFLAAALALVGASTVSADYILVKINLNKLDFHTEAIVMPGIAQPPGAGGKQPGVQPPGPNGPGMAAPQAPPEDPNARWIYAFVEVKGAPARLMPIMVNNAPTWIWQFDHRWGTKNWLPAPGPNSQLPQVVFNRPYPDALNNFGVRLIKEKKDKEKNIEGILVLARLALQHGSMKRFHTAMKEAVEANPKHGVVVQYQRVKKELEKPFNDTDPAQRGLLKDLAENKYQVKISEQKHYALHHPPVGLNDRHTDALVKRRLAMLEGTFETFYYWFAVQKENALQPPMPKYRLQVVLANTKEEFLTRHLQWGSEPIVGDGFAPRRDNFIVMSAKPRVNDPLYQEFDSLLTTKLAEVNTKLGANLTRDDLLSGKVNENKLARIGAVPLAYAQVAVLLAKTLEDEAERLTATNEGVRQLLIAADVFPRHVQIPDWMVEGLSAFFETPPGLYPTIGSKSWTHLVSYKYLRNSKDRRVDNPANMLFNVVTDRYFHDARVLAANLRQSPNNNDFRLASRDAWELARCTSWAFVYYLAQTGKLDALFKYGKELDALPRDMDLSDLVVQGCFARAFEMTDNADPRRIDQAKLTSTANAWSTMMQETNLDGNDGIVVQNILLDLRAKQESAGMDSSKPAADGGAPNPGGNNPPKQGSGLAGTTWSGTENFQGTSKVGFRFQDGGVVTMLEKSGVGPGTWTQTDNDITMTFGDVTYTGMLNGSAIQGTATNGQATWNFSVARGGPQIQPGLRPAGPPRKSGG